MIAKKIKKPDLYRTYLNTVPSVIPMAFLFLVIGITIYSNTLNSQFQFDDYYRIFNNTAINNIKNIDSIWNYNNSRFVGYLSFALNYHFHHLHVFGYHVVNLLIHILTSCFVWWLATLILSTPEIRKTKISKHKRILAFGCGLLFLSHPLQTQAVTYIIQRLTSLAALFYLSSLCFYIQARLLKKRIMYLFFLISAIIAVLGIFTKEIVFTYPFSVLLVEIYFFYGVKNIKAFFKNRNFWLSLIPFLSFLLILPYLLSFNISRILSSTSSHRYLDPPLTSFIYLMTQFRVIVTYIRLLFLPINQNLDYDFPASQSFFEISTILSFIFLISLILIAFRIFVKHRLLSFGIIWFFLTMSVDSSIIPLHNVIFEHRMYLPMFGYSLFLISFLYNLICKNNIKATVIILMLLICINSIMTYKRNRVWKTQITLYTDVVKKSPNKSRPHYNLGLAYSNCSMYESAKHHYYRALNINPYYVDAYINLGKVLFSENKIEESIKLFNTALEINQNNSLAYTNLGNVLFKKGNIKEAKEKFNKALEINPQQAETFISMGNVFAQENKTEEAEERYNHALSINPNLAEAYLKLGNLFFIKDELEEAKKQYYKSLSINPYLIPAYNNLGTIFLNKGNTGEAKKQYFNALSINPNYAMAYYNIGKAFKREENIKEAMKYYYKALDIDPENSSLHHDIGIELWKEKNVNKAIEHFQKSLKIQDSFQTHFLLGVALKEQKRYDEAVRHFLETLRKKPDHIHAREELAAIYRLQGKEKEANAQLKKL